VDRPKRPIAIADRLGRRLLPVALAVAVLVGGGIPTTYFGIELIGLRRDARALAEALAERVLGIVHETPALWRFQDDRLKTLVDDAVSDPRVVTVRLVDAAGKTLAERRGASATDQWWWKRDVPVLESAPVRFEAVPVATAEVSLSTRALTRTTSALLLVCVGGGIVLAVLLYSVPVGVVAGMDAQIQALFTELERANDELTTTAHEIRRAYDELSRMQDQLVQAQKMEAIGQLVGGIAHNFNNLLTVILGRSELLLNRVTPTDSLWRQVDVIHQTAHRAAQLTRQMLAFGRKQVLRPTLVDLDAMLSRLEKLLRPLLPESVEVVISTPEAPSPVRVDEAQLEQVMIHLAVNARDAMPDGGRLTIELANVELDEPFTRSHPGTAVGPAVSVSMKDTGVGMDEETRARLFEPFFTTKGPGGTGLGLAAVHGTVKQSGGAVFVDSAPGRGTTFTIYLPRAEARAHDPEAPARPDRGAETVLVVEDEGGVREFTRETLESHGYRVLVAAHAGEALETAARHAGPIHLLLTDVVMPGTGGPALARELGRARPETKVLYMSGHTEVEAVQSGALEPLLVKPFTSARLTGTVREVLDGRQTGDRPPRAS
jgi:signal transduction histidine kinase/ActR/RegA family two-component response regulator